MKPKLKIMGIETTRSSTPQVVRDSLKEAINLILTTDEDTVIDFIDKFKTQFFKYTPEQIAFREESTDCLDMQTKIVSTRSLHRLL